MSLFLPLLLLAPVASSAATLDDAFVHDRFLLGHWLCQVRQGARSPLIEQATYTAALGGKWLRLNYRLRRPTGWIETHAYEGYDPDTRKWVYSSFSSDGTFGTSYSDGWAGDRKIYKPASSAPAQFTFTAVRLSDERFTEQVEVPSSKGAQTVFIMTCNKR